MDFFSGISAWHMWLIAGAVLIIAEIIGTEFILLALGLAALITALVTAVFSIEMTGQVGTYAIAALVLVPVTVLFYRRKFKATGARTLVSEGFYRDSELSIELYGERTGVRIQGDFYPAQSTEGDPLQAGELVRVLEMRGVTAIVERI
jgi:membrane protein implicated in regulation of membrane protease activity